MMLKIKLYIILELIHRSFHLIFIVSAPHIWIGTPNLFAVPNSSLVIFKEIRLFINGPIICRIELLSLELSIRAFISSSEFDSLISSLVVLVLSIIVSSFFSDR